MTGDKRRCMVCARVIHLRYDCGFAGTFVNFKTRGFLRSPIEVGKTFVHLREDPHTPHHGVGSSERDITTFTYWQPHDVFRIAVIPEKRIFRNAFHESSMHLILPLNFQPHQSDVEITDEEQLCHAGGAYYMGGGLM